MTRIDEILSRALLVPERTVPRDIVPPWHPDPHSGDTSTEPNAAAEDLRALCETVVTHTPAADVADFVTEQVPQPRSALVLACVLQLTDTSEGARFWWEYAAGAGQPAAAYCLYLHHLALGESETANWWHSQTNDVQPPPQDAEQKESLPTPGTEWHPATHPVTQMPTTTILRLLRHLARDSERTHSTAVNELMDYIPTAVAVGYLREPDLDLPMPGPHFADDISALLDTAAKPSDAPSTLPARTDPDARPVARKSRRARIPEVPDRPFIPSGENPPVGECH
ncbi:hypothetical protein OG758_48695 [Streptomyces sp. NBC_01474]|uniref:hypothetical protein n=1 Tax=Streptomyces sp. NBC_01474 TaxID=2903880 RepID=UPI002DDBFF1C|nr:hypothetical protein [Streptomyces sp. NBC_01474]WSD92771.1 hypothetical protein OG758_00095 [Streptomyces sp. NBC_01474]WSE01284.1 hypothetical protein OG758_48695 [Streptomyces sp. NBC_01474]